MNQNYQIYIDKKQMKNCDVYRMFVYCNRELCWIGGYVSLDPHQKIYRGTVRQCFLNGKAKIQLEDNSYLYAEHTFKGKRLNVGDVVWVQAKGISPLEMAHKDPKGTLNIALSFGPILLYPFETGVHISQRLKQYPEFVQYLKQHFEPLAGRYGIKFRLSSKNYSLKLLTQITAFVKSIWENEEYNDPKFIILNQLLSYCLYPTEIFTNDLNLKEWLAKKLYEILDMSPNVKSLPTEIENLEDDWDEACRLYVQLSNESNLMIEETSGGIVIDVNAGFNSSYTNVNQEAVKVLPGLLSQKGLGGKFMVDLLPISSSVEREQLLKQFDIALTTLDISAQVFGISRMGLLEFILPRRGYPLWWIDKNFLKLK
jgi:Ribonuclease G/E